MRGGGLGAVIDASIWTLGLWLSFVLSKLKQPMRNAADLEYYDYVDGICEDVEQTYTIQL